MVTHDLDSLFSICDRVAALADGKVIAAGPLGELLKSSHPWLRSYFHGVRGGRLTASAAGSRRRIAPSPTRPSSIAAQAAGLQVCAYHFAEMGDPVAEAQRFLLAGEAGGTGHGRVGEQGLKVEIDDGETDLLGGGSGLFAMLGELVLAQPQQRPTSSESLSPFLVDFLDLHKLSLSQATLVVKELHGGNYKEK